MKKNIALVLSSGGARGIAHIGVIEKILEMGYNITSISGTSIGALIGGIYASGNLPEFKDWICNMKRRDVISLMDFQLKGEGFIKGHKVFKQMEHWLEPHSIEHLEIPLSIVATDILNREEVLFTEGNLLNTIRASVAVPGFVAPIHLNNKWLFDGGVINPLPLNRVQRTKNDLLVAVDLNAFVSKEETTETIQSEPSRNPKIPEVKKWIGQKLKRDTEENERLKISYFNLMNQMFDMMQEQISTASLEAIKPDVLIKIPRDICNTFEFEKSNEMVKLGHQSTELAFKNVSQAASLSYDLTAS